MASIKEFDKPSPWLKKEDVDVPRVLTITRIEKEMASDGRVICAAYFRETEKKADLNKTNRLILGAIAKTHDYTQWAGLVAEYYNDLTVVYGDTVGGVRCRPARNHIPASLQEGVPADEKEETDVSW